MLFQYMIKYKPQTVLFILAIINFIVLNLQYLHRFKNNCCSRPGQTFENFESNFFSFESVLSSDKTDPDKNFFNDKLQQIDSPYFSVENFIAISEQLNKDNFSILHLNIRSLNANIDNFREFLAIPNNFVIVLTESWCDETANENSLLNFDNHYSVDKTRNNKKGVVEFGFIYTNSWNLS